MDVMDPSGQMAVDDGVPRAERRRGLQGRSRRCHLAGSHITSTKETKNPDGQIFRFAKLREVPRLLDPDEGISDICLFGQSIKNQAAWLSVSYRSLGKRKRSQSFERSSRTPKPLTKILLDDHRPTTYLTLITSFLPTPKTTFLSLITFTLLYIQI